MSLASSNRVAVRRVKETVFGTIPATPVLLDTRYTGESFNYNISNIVSEEIRADRMTSDLIQVQSDASGDINVELSYGSYDDFIESALADTFSADLSISGTDIAADSTGHQFTSSTTDFAAAGLVVGQWFRVSGFTNTNINKYYKATSVAANAIGVVTGSVPATEASGQTVDIDGSMIRNGITESSFTIQKHIQDATVPTFINFNGTRIGGMSLTFATGQILTGSFNLMALGAATSTSQIAGATVTPVGSAAVMNAVDNVTEIYEDDTLSTSNFSNLTLNISNNLRAQDAIGSLPHVGIAMSRLEVTGDISIYFEDNVMYDKYVNATQFSLSFRVQDAAGNAYVFTLPAVKFESGSVVSGGLDQDIILEASWRAIADPTTNCMVQIDRVAA